MGRKRILLVEDHDDSRELLAALLRRWGLEVFAYDGCKPAERHLAACDVDVALLDVRMPGRCGDDFARELRARCPNTMIVFVTGESLIDPLRAAIPGCFVLRKPFDAEVLRELLAGLTPEACNRPSAPEGMDDRPGAAGT